MALCDFVLKDQSQAINDNFEEKLRREHKSLIKSKRGEDMDNQEGGTTFMITTAAAVWEVCVVKGDRARERAESKDKDKTRGSAPSF